VLSDVLVPVPPSTSRYHGQRSTTHGCTRRRRSRSQLAHDGTTPDGTGRHQTTKDDTLSRDLCLAAATLGSGARKDGGVRLSPLAPPLLMAGTIEFAIRAARPGWKACTRASFVSSSAEGSPFIHPAGAFFELPVDSLDHQHRLDARQPADQDFAGRGRGSMEPFPLAVRRRNKFPQALSHRLEYRDGKSRISLESVLEVSPG
jgi:hypothetical protein